MAKKQAKKKPRPAKSLRLRAEEMLRTSPQDISGMPTEDVHALVHELQVHQMELEIQNEELREAQVELTESRNRFSDLYEFAPVGYLTLQQDGTIQQANLRAADMLHVHRRDLIGRKFSEFVDRDGQDQWHLHRQAVFGEKIQPSGQTPVSSAVAHACELLLRTSQRSLWARVASTFFRDEQDATSYCRTALMDISERKQAEEALRESHRLLRASEERLRASERHFRTVVETAGSAIVGLTPDHKIMEWNREAELISGWSRAEVIGENYLERLLPAEIRETVADNIRRTLAGEPSYDHENPIVCRDGSRRVISWNASRMLDEADQPVGIIAIGRDVSEQKRAEQSRKELEKQVIDAATDEQRRIGQDIHDGIGQELTGLRYMAQTHAESLAQQSSPDAKTAERMTVWLATVQEQLRAIIRQLVPVEVDQLGLVAALRGLAKQTQESHDLACEFQCPQPVTVADAALATHLYRIVQEAVMNAVRHAQAAHIRIELIEDDATLRLQVTDDGVGIRSTAEKSSGIGLRSMAYRAGLIGATFVVAARKQGGTQVICTVLRGGGGRRWMANA
jgi:PAS domain S-box-containing protein